MTKIVTTRRGFFQKSGVLLAVTALYGAAARNAHAAALIPKKLADYRPKPMGGHECAGCCMFIPAGPAASKCTMIEGSISPHGWCKYWKPGQPDSCQ
jgi:hypothetical protein